MLNLISVPPSHWSDFLILASDCCDPLILHTTTLRAILVQRGTTQQVYRTESGSGRLNLVQFCYENVKDID